MEPAAAATTPPAGWFADPHLPNVMRWWDGIQWTQHVHPPAPAAPGQLAPGAQAHHGQQAHHAHAQAHHAQAVQTQQSGHGLLRNDFAATPVRTAGHGSAAGGIAASGIAAGVGAFPAHNAYAAQASTPVTATTATASQAIPRSEPSLLDANPKSLLAILVSVLYLVMAVMTGIVLAGIFPAILTFRAFEGREKLAPAALVAAVIAIGFAFTHMHVTR